MGWQDGQLHKSNIADVIYRDADGEQESDVGYESRASLMKAIAGSA